MRPCQQGAHHEQPIGTLCGQNTYIATIQCSRRACKDVNNCLAPKMSVSMPKQDYRCAEKHDTYLEDTKDESREDRPQYKHDGGTS